MSVVLATILLAAKDGAAPVVVGGGCGILGYVVYWIVAAVTGKPPK